MLQNKTLDLYQLWGAVLWVLILTSDLPRRAQQKRQFSSRAIKCHISLRRCSGPPVTLLRAHVGARSHSFTVQTEHGARVKPLLLPWRSRQRSPLDRRMERETRGGRRERGPPPSCWLTVEGGGLKCHTLWSLVRSASRGPFGMQMKRVALAHPCSALSLPLVCCSVGYSEPPSRNGVEYPGKTARESGQKEERGYQAYGNGKTTSALV